MGRSSLIIVLTVTINVNIANVLFAICEYKVPITEKQGPKKGMVCRKKLLFKKKVLNIMSYAFWQILITSILVIPNASCHVCGSFLLCQLNKFREKFEQDQMLDNLVKKFPKGQFGI